MKLIPLFFFLLVLPVAAQIASGGGQTADGSGTNYSSIGSPFATGQRVISTGKNLTGRIEVLCASGPVDPDTDSDGMPDAWEQTHGLAVGIDDSELDLDGDKTPNLLEWLAGTDPNDQSSTFRPLGTHDGTDYHLSVPTITGRSYKISISLNLQDWLPYGTLNGDDTSQVWTFDETTVPDGPFYSNRHPDRYFFRIEIGILNP